MTMNVTIPKIQSKYITAFKNESSYDAAYPTFEEVNWSAIKPAVGPEELPDEYRLSRRLSHMYVNGTPPDYKFSSVDEYVPYDAQTEKEKTYADAHQIAHYNTEGCPANQMTPDDIRKTFFLEIVWGYSGWEWHDYERVIGTDPDTEEPITETLKGGNLYKIKDIETVPHIIDGYRLQHINDFLFSQYNVKWVEGFNTQNLVAANRAFKRGTNLDTNYPIRNADNVLECHFIDGQDENGDFNHPFGYADPATGESLLENLVEADGLFYNNKVYMYDGDFINSIPFTIPNIESIDRLYSYGVYTDNLKFKMESLIQLTNTFKGTMFPQHTVNLNNIFVGDTLKNIENFSGMLAGASIFGTQEIDSEDVATVILDLSDSNVSASITIDLSHFAEWIGNGYTRNSLDRRIKFSFTFANKVDLSYLFANANVDKWVTFDGISKFNNSGFRRIIIDFNNTESYIRSLDFAFTSDIFEENLPILARPHNDCTDNSIYEGCTFNAAITYDFSPNSTVYDSAAQFKNAKVYNGYSFSNIDCLINVNFEGFKIYDNNVLTTDSLFNYVLNNPNYNYLDGGRYQTVTFKNSNIASFPVQSFYVDMQAGTTDIFTGMANINFTSSYKLYLRDFTQTVTNKSLPIPNFAGCTNMTETPEIYYNFDGSGVSVMRTGQQFEGCDSLVTLNCTNVNLVRTIGGSGTNEATLVFSSPVLRYFNIGNWDIPIEIRSAVLDITTFKASMLRQSATNRQWKKIWIHTDVYDTLEADTSFWASLNAAYRTVGRYIPNN